MCFFWWGEILQTVPVLYTCIIRKGSVHDAFTRWLHCLSTAGMCKYGCSLFYSGGGSNVPE